MKTNNNIDECKADMAKAPRPLGSYSFWPIFLMGGFTTYSA